MGSAAIKEKTAKERVSEKRAALKVKLGNAKESMNLIAEFVREGDIASVTDLISAYISNSPNYKTKEDFAKAIGTSRTTLHRLLCNDSNVSMQVFFAAIERIHSDSK